jgi:hypothetical protein
MNVTTFAPSLASSRLSDSFRAQHRPAAENGRAKPADAEPRRAARERKEKVISPEQAAEYVRHKNETTIHDVGALKTEVRAWRKVYEPIYQPIRHSTWPRWMSKKNIDEMKRMFGFQCGLRLAVGLLAG